MEYLDVLDENGSPTGEKKSKPDVHRGGNWHKTVHVWVINPAGELLIQKRSPDIDSYPNMWDISSAGHVLAGENSITSALREIHEELGLEVKPENFEYLFTVVQQAVLNDGTYINNEFNDVYLLKFGLNPSEFKLQKEEVSAIRWMPYKELKEIIKNGSSDFVPHPDEYAKLFVELDKRCL